MKSRQESRRAISRGKMHRLLELACEAIDADRGASALIDADMVRIAGGLALRFTSESFTLKVFLTENEEGGES